MWTLRQRAGQFCDSITTCRIALLPDSRRNTQNINLTLNQPQEDWENQIRLEWTACKHVLSFVPKQWHQYTWTTATSSPHNSCREARDLNTPTQNSDRKARNTNTPAQNSDMKARNINTPTQNSDRKARTHKTLFKARLGKKLTRLWLWAVTWHTSTSPGCRKIAACTNSCPVWRRSTACRCPWLRWRLTVGRLHFGGHPGCDWSQLRA